MMKKTFFAVLAVLMTLALMCSLVGCGSDNTAATEAAQTAETVEAATDTAPAETTAADTGSDDSFSKDDTVFTYNGTSVVLNDEAEAIIAALGEPVSISAQLSCHGGEGDDKTYVYDGFSVGTYPKDGVDRILEVVISAEGIPTSKGVAVGDPAAKVVETYGEGYRAIGMYYAYETEDGNSLQFFIENDTVAEIDYYYDV